jgi:hypothetical protein
MDAVADQRHDDQQPDPRDGQQASPGSQAGASTSADTPEGTAAGSPDAPGASSAPVPAPGGPPSVASGQHGPGDAQVPATQLDPEQLRLFQEFQQFQQFKRFQEFQQAQQQGLIPPATQQAGTALPAPPVQPPSAAVQQAGPAHTGQLQPAAAREVMPSAAGEANGQPTGKGKAPRWLVSLGGKILGALLMLAAIVVGAAIAIDYFFGADDPVSPEEHASLGGKKAEGTKLYASNPYEAVRRVYDDIAQGATEDICYRFDEAAREQFASAFNHETCSDAAAELHSKVTDADSYAESLPSHVSNPQLGDEIEIDSCQVGIAPGGVVGGPALGVFTVSKIPNAEGDQWIITEYVPGPEKCPRKP